MTTICFLILLLPFFVLAQTDDWYIKSFESQITVNYDSSLNISEKIIADAGNLPDKHGIFRILPTVYYPDDKQKIKMGLNSITITDFENNPLNYEIIKDYYNYTQTLKIGDKNKTVQGENNYLIKYNYKNTIRFQNNNFDELYWNLNGNFWEISINNYSAEIFLPKEITPANSEINLYSGRFEQKDSGLADYRWNSENHSIVVRSKSILNPGDGITISLTFPKGIILPYQPTFWEKISYYVYFVLFLLPPIITLVVCLKIWRKYGHDLPFKKTIIAEYEPPYNLSPMEVGFIYTASKPNIRFTTASIVDLAIRGFIKIEEISKGKYKFVLTNPDISQLKEYEKIIMNGIFENLIPNQEVKLDYLKNKFYTKIKVINKSIKEQMVTDGFFDERGFKYTGLFFAGGLLALFLGIGLSIFLSQLLIIADTVVVTFIIFFFAAIMVKLTAKGSEALWKIKGFKLYIKTAEKYRQEFNERENIFEKILPYAIIFGLVKLWIKKIKEIYGDDYFNKYQAAWFYGATSSGFNIDNFSSSISQLTSNMNSAMASSPSSSGSSGGGFSGGGGGGGGGGGW
ncbi:MAG: DUF2207 domain-containing protein [Candidatus Buchananbacteria bacterium]|nr:DUF2207 domain-containing protein [Candidatus Buchananbacteria bacterium]